MGGYRPRELGVVLGAFAAWVVCRGLQSPWGLPLAGTWANVLSNGANPASGCTPELFGGYSPRDLGWCWALSRLRWFMSREPVPMLHATGQPRRLSV